MSGTRYTGVWSPKSFKDGDFSNVDFSNRVLVGADFSGSVCKDCDFSGCDLSQANFRGADLYRCNFARSILYAVEFDDANLTRARFSQAYTYGWLLNSSANITYADLLDFAVEKRRRSVALVSEASENVREVKFGAIADSTPDLCARSYQVGSFRFTFEDLDRREEALQRSQIYNRLKRLFRENQNGEAALHCLYNERYHLTRSHYRYSPMTGGLRGGDEFKTVAKTIAAYLVEFLSGYGVRPVRILRNMAILLFVHFIVASVIVATSRPGALVRNTVTCEEMQVMQGVSQKLCLSHMLPIDESWNEFFSRVQYSVITMVNPDPQSFLASGLLAPVSLVFFIASAVLLAVLFSSIFVRLLSD